MTAVDTEAARERQVTVSHTIPASREIVFRAFTEPRHLEAWWGPDGFRTTTHAFEFRVGGVWDYTMHGPDGTDYPNWSRFREIVPPRRLVYVHGKHADDPDQFETTLTLEERDGVTTVTLRSLFRTKAQRDEVVRRYDAERGAHQHVRRLAEFCRQEGAGTTRRVAEGELRVACFAVSIDGYGAGPDQSREQPLGVRGTELHEWMIATRSFKAMHGGEGGTTGVDDDFARRSFENVGAWIMGRNMFGPVRGSWGDGDWRGWWGDDPPYHCPVFVLTHHPRAPLAMNGGTTFHFVTDGIEAALDRARDAAGGRDVRIGGGVDTVRQYLRAGLVDEVHLVLSPVLLGSGEALLPGLDLPALGFAVSERVDSGQATHLVLRRDRAAS